MITVKAKLNLGRVGKGRQTLRIDYGTPPVAPTRVPRVARLVALALRFDRLLREGQVSSVSELAELAHVTQPRATQILNLSLLAPDILEELLHLPPIERGRDPVHEKMLRPVAAITGWSAQRHRWCAVHGDIHINRQVPDGELAASRSAQKCREMTCKGPTADE